MTYVYNFKFWLIDESDASVIICPFQICSRKPSLNQDMIDYAKACVITANNDYYHNYTATLISITMTSVSD